MTKTTLIPDLPMGFGLRQRQRADGSLRLWWEPTTGQRAGGAVPVDLDAGRITWSVREAMRLHKAAGKDGAGKARKPRVGHTIDHLIDEYERSPSFRQLAPKTQSSYRYFLKVIRDKWGSWLVVDFTKPIVHTWYEALYDQRGHYLALNVIRLMSILFSYAERSKGWRAEGSNPCAKLRMRVPHGRRRTGTWAELDALDAAARAIGLPSMAVAINLALFNGPRQTDVRQARRGDFTMMRGADDQLTVIWQLVRSKRGNETLLRLHAETARLVAAILAGPGAADAVLLADDRTGQAWSEDLFSKRFADVRDAAIRRGTPSLRGLQFRDLRRTFGALSRAGGADKADVADVLGNSAAVNPRLGDIYMAPQMITTARAIDAIQRPQSPERKKA